MDLPLVLTVIGLVLLVVVLSIVYSGDESGRLRSASAAARYLENLAGKPGWTRVSDEEDMPAGRMSALPGLGRRGTVAGVHERRAVSPWRATSWRSSRRLRSRLRPPRSRHHGRCAQRRVAEEERVEAARQRCHAQQQGGEAAPDRESDGK